MFAYEEGTEEVGERDRWWAGELRLTRSCCDAGHIIRRHCRGSRINPDGRGVSGHAERVLPRQLR